MAPNVSGSLLEYAGTFFGWLPELLPSLPLVIVVVGWVKRTFALPMKDVKVSVKFVFDFVRQSHPFHSVVHAVQAVES